MVLGVYGGEETGGWGGGDGGEMEEGEREEREERAWDWGVHLRLGF